MLHTDWDRWMAENLRYALRHNKIDHKMPETFAEYKYLAHYSDAAFCHWIDVVGKPDMQKSLREGIAIEIKSGMSDVLTGYGQNFVGKYNFLAADYKFCDRLLRHMQENVSIYAGIGLLKVEADGSVHTILPSMEFAIEADFSFFCSDEEVAIFFEQIELPTQRQCDLRKEEIETETIYVQVRENA